MYIQKFSADSFKSKFHFIEQQKTRFVNIHTKSYHLQNNALCLVFKILYIKTYHQTMKLYRKISKWCTLNLGKKTDISIGRAKALIDDVTLDLSVLFIFPLNQTLQNDIFFTCTLEHLSQNFLHSHKFYLREKEDWFSLWTIPSK